MILNVKALEKALQHLDLSDDVMAMLKDVLEKTADGNSVDLQSFLNQLPMDVIAQIQSLIEPAAGEEPQHDLHGRMQDAESFQMHNSDITTGDPDHSETDMMTGLKLTMAGPLDDTSLPQEETDDEDDSGFSGESMMMLSKNQALFSQIFGDNPDTLFNFEYRSITAEGNNQINPYAGSTGSSFMSVSHYQYQDGMGMPNDLDRPNVREISNEIFAQSGDIFNQYGASNFLWVWGQFLDHDINLTREGHGETYAINIPTGDPFFDPFGTGTQTMSFTRSGYMDGTGDNIDDPRLQMNDITAFIDASNIYGSTADVLAQIRGDGGTLLMSAGDLLPTIIGDHGAEFQSGDVRVNENVGLTSMHTIFAREHNYWVKWIAGQNPDYTDEQLFQAAKSIVEAEIQHITYDEFLPTLLGDHAISDYSGYNATIDPQIATEFATAAFRVGHTMLSSDIFRLQENGDESAFGHLTLQGAFFRPDIIMSQGGIDEILRGLGSSYSQAIDASVIDDVRNFLFGPPGAGGFDLVSLNIQRGRDHGIPDFNSVREAYGLDPLDDFSDLTTDGTLITKLTALYGDIDHLDLWVGGLIENPFGDAMVGETFYTIISDQFTRLRDGDRFWYEERFNGDFLDLIQNTSLSDILLRNTDIDYLQNDIFTAQIRLGGDENDNIINGTDQGDLLIGFGGDDILNGGEGQDTLYGGEGNDIFAFDTIVGGMDTIRDFDTAHDKIDVSDLLHLFDPLVDSISDFLGFTQQSDDTVISIDQDGSGNLFTFENFVSVENVNADDALNFIIYNS